MNVHYRKLTVLANNVLGSLIHVAYEVKERTVLVEGDADRSSATLGAVVRQIKELREERKFNYIEIDMDGYGKALLEKCKEAGLPATPKSPNI